MIDCQKIQFLAKIKTEVEHYADWLLAVLFGYALSYAFQDGEDSYDGTLDINRLLG